MNVTSKRFTALGIALKLPDWTHTLQFRLILGFAASLAVCLFAVSVWTTVNTRVAIQKYGDRVERFQEDRARRLLQEVYDYDQDLSHLQDSVQQVAHLFSQRVAVVDDEGFVVADSHVLPIDTDGKFQKESDRFDKKSDLRFVPLRLGTNLSGKVIFTEPGEMQRQTIKVWLDIEPQRFLRRSESQRKPTTGHDATVIIVDDREARDEIFGERSDEDPDGPIALSVKAVNELSVEPQLSALQDEFQRSLIVSGIAGGITGILIIAFFTRRAFAPMRDLTETAERLGKGELDQRVRSDHRGEIGQLAASFNTMATELEDAETRRRRLTADIAHELRTPLTNIRGYLEAVKDGVVEPDDQTIGTLHQETLHLSALVDDLRLLAVADAGALKLEMLPDRVETVVESVSQAFKARSMESDVEMKFEIAEGLPLVDIDRTRMTQIIQNLVENAIHHSPTSGEIVVRVDKSIEGDEVTISVTDTGDGIPKDDIEHIFEQFYRVDTSRARATGGTGLGLTIVKRLVDAHRGQIKVTSKPGTGSTFTVTFPASQTSDAHD